MNDLLYQTTEYALGLIAARNEAGIDILYEYMGKTMLFVAKNVVKDDFAAEDVVQESFLKIVKNISKYKRGTNGYAWVCRIVRNTALNAVKSENAHGGRSIDEFVNIADGKDFEEMSQTRMLAEKNTQLAVPSHRKADGLYEIFPRYDRARDSKGRGQIKVICIERADKSRRKNENYAARRVDKMSGGLVI